MSKGCDDPEEGLMNLHGVLRLRSAQDDMQMMTDDIGTP
jgi:hypothetical protein